MESARTRAFRREVKCDVNERIFTKPKLTGQLLYLDVLQLKNTLAISVYYVAEYVTGERLSASSLVCIHNSVLVHPCVNSVQTVSLDFRY